MTIEPINILSIFIVVSLILTHRFLTLKLKLLKNREELRIVQIEQHQVFFIVSLSFIKDKIEIITVIKRIERITRKERRTKQKFYS